MQLFSFMLYHYCLKLLAKDCDPSEAEWKILLVENKGNSNNLYYYIIKYFNKNITDLNFISFIMALCTDPNSDKILLKKRT